MTTRELLTRLKGMGYYFKRHPLDHGVWYVERWSRLFLPYALLDCRRLNGKIYCHIRHENGILQTPNTKATLEELYRQIVKKELGI